VVVCDEAGLLPKFAMSGPPKKQSRPRKSKPKESDDENDELSELRRNILDLGGDETEFKRLKAINEKQLGATAIKPDVFHVP
jgi:hypothetical protein